MDFQIIYITRGHGNYYIDGKMKRIGEGCIVLYRPHQRQEYYYLPDNTEVYWVHFTGKDAQKHIADMDSGMEIGISNEVSQIFTSIIYALQTRRPMFHEIANALFLQLIYTIKQCAEEFKKGRVDIDIENLILTMQNEYNKSGPWTKWHAQALANTGLPTNLRNIWELRLFNILRKSEWTSQKAFIRKHHARQGKLQAFWV